MTELSSPARRWMPSRIRLSLNLLLSFALLALLVSVRPARADEPEEAYLPIYAQIQDAEALEASGQSAQALTNYQKAAVALKEFQRKHPDWNAKVVGTRLVRLAAKIDALSKKPATAAPSGTQAASPAAAANASASSGTGPVKLLQPGGEPRQALRLHPKAGDKQTMEMTMTFGMANKTGPVETPMMKFPPIKMTLEVGVKEVSPQGDITYDLAVTDTSVGEDPDTAPGMAEMLKASLGTAKGLSGTATITDRGITKAMNVKLANGGGEQNNQGMDQMKEMLSGAALMLPEEAVGVGAKWEVRKVEKAQGVSVNATQSYELVAVEGDRLTVKVTQTQSAANQKIQSPSGGKVATKMELTKLAGTGTTEITGDLGHVMPMEATAKHHIDKVITVTAPQKQTATQKMDVEVHLQAK